METSETVTGKRERAAAQGAMDSDVPRQTQEKRCRVGDIHPALFADKEKVMGHVQW